MTKRLPIIFVFTLIGFVVLSFVFPTIAQDALKKKKELSRLRYEERLIPSLSSALVAKREDVALIRESFPEKKDFALVASAIDTLAVQTGVLVDLHFTSEDVVKEAGGDMTIPVKIVVEGDFANVKSFLEGLANGKYLYVFEKIDGAGALPEGVRGKNKVTITAKLYAAIQ